MALSLPGIPIPVSSSSSSRTATNYPNIQTPIKFAPIPLTNSPILKTNQHRRVAVIVNAGEERQQQNPISESDPTQQNPPPSNDEKEQTDLGAEIKKAMMDREMKKDDGFWGGVVEEIGKIEWPAFGKVIGTTGVVMGVIAGSSVVLLTVNAVLAELSDRVFLGKGVQDFFG